MRLLLPTLMGAFAVLAPPPGSALALLRMPLEQSPDGAAGPLLALVALTGWALLLWLALVGTALLATRLPGAPGAGASCVAARLAPAAVRRLLAVALGIGLAAGTSAAWAAGPGGPGGQSGSGGPRGPALDWPVAAAPAAFTDGPSLDWPVAAGHPAVAPPPAAYVVRQGDSLWSIAAAQLPPHAGPARVASAWPAWWSANRSRIGADPDLIHPGTRLTPPPEKE